MFGIEFYVDPSRCIGCQSCLKACEECDTHRGVSMINFDFVDRREAIATAAYVCWHCDEPTCAQVCPADAIKKYEDGIVGSSLKPRCIGCSNCVLACPFGIPKLVPEYEQMMKCDMCYDRTSVGKRPMCATVCPSQALAYVTPETIAATRREKPVNTFWFGNQKITTKVYMMAPAGTDAIAHRCRGLYLGGRMKLFRRPSSAPLWQDEFSVFTADERYVNRRQFTKFLTLTSLACSREICGFWSDRYSTERRRIRVQAVAALDEVPVGGVKLFTYPTPRRSLHPGAHRSRFLRSVQPEVHAPFLRGLLRKGAEPAGMPVPPGILLDRRWSGSARPAAAPLPRVALRNGRAALLASAWKEKGRERRSTANPRADGHRWRHGR